MFNGRSSTRRFLKQLRQVTAALIWRQECNDYGARFTTLATQALADFRHWEIIAKACTELDQ
jgi:hypothetical protein